MDDARYESIAAKLDADESDAITVKEWPTLPPEALHGLAGDAVRLATADCEADPAAVLTTFLAWFGCACGQPDGSTPYLRIGETRHAPRLFAAVVGASSRARKGTSKYPVQRLMEAAHLSASSCLVGSLNNKSDTNARSGESLSPSNYVVSSNYLGGGSRCPTSEGPLSSGEGIIYRLRDASEETDDDGRPIDKGSADKRLIVIEGELGGVFKVMQREGSIVSTVLRVAWDGGTIEPLTKTSRIRASNPHLCIVGHITADELKELLTAVDLRNGLANRFLWVMARRTRLVSRPKAMPDDAVAALAGKIGAALNRATPGQVAWSVSALALWDALYPELTGEREGAWGYATGRAEAQVPRLSLIYALLDSRMVIEPEHLQAAYAMWRYCDASARYLFAESAADPVGNKILDALRAAGGAMTQTEIYRSFGCNMPADKLAVVLSTLQEHGRISSERQKTGGKPRVTWRLLNYVISSNKPPDSHPDLSNYYLLRNIEDRGQPDTLMPVDNSASRPVDNFPSGAMPVDNSISTELAKLAGLDVAKMMAGDLNEADWSRFAAASVVLSERHPDAKFDISALLAKVDAAYSTRVAP